MTLAIAEAGADVVAILSSWDPPAGQLEESIHKSGREFSVFHSEVSDSADLRRCFHDIWGAGVEPDILLNCSIMNRRGPIENMKDEDIDLVLSVNLKAAYVAAQEVGSRMIQRLRKGKIINFGSATAHLAMTDVSVYAAAKAGVLQMTKAFSNEWAAKGIQVNNISPGYSTAASAISLSSQNPEMASYITNRTPAGRLGTPADFRGVVVFLCSAASDFVTGSSIFVDGGLMAR
ncbi:uncharacterized protein Z519_02180 [Cladophialophora bantiana CBS 173.52]|uniref:Gluconate 5-dehydrogenase n=1 Tax=Cladophialophora bantiana (strain ATCC 10958 / CBS 173.52 / CDC B-1940 / NIH 8579) TaxID=1442370 RepID=A0A0D2IJ35_CLAB1|nr:uncharacterized protein Z519_02180 [Cladophialophora bantiana CBS 173.52]KIW96789.1 hypothetical protein Z519_02180 [Cladophialophora bantiana CBS 173.52]